MERTESIMLLDAKQTARLLGVSERTIHRWKQAGLMPEPAMQSNRKCRWAYDDLKNLMQNRTKPDKSRQGA